MPIFTPDMDRVRSKLGRPWKLWFTTAWWESITLVYRNGSFEVLESPSEEDLVGCQLVFQQRENWVSYQDVRTYDLTSWGAVHYIDDYDDEYDDYWISIENPPFARADHSEPIG